MKAALQQQSLPLQVLHHVLQAVSVPAAGVTPSLLILRIRLATRRSLKDSVCLLLLSGVPDGRAPA